MTLLPLLMPNICKITQTYIHGSRDNNIYTQIYVKSHKHIYIGVGTAIYIQDNDKIINRIVAENHDYSIDIVHSKILLNLFNRTTGIIQDGMFTQGSTISNLYKVFTSLPFILIVVIENAIFIVNSINTISFLNRKLFGTQIS